MACRAVSHKFGIWDTHICVQFVGVGVPRSFHRNLTNIGEGMTQSSSLSKPLQPVCYSVTPCSKKYYYLIEDFNASRTRPKLRILNKK